MASFVDEQLENLSQFEQDEISRIFAKIAANESYITSIGVTFPVDTTDRSTWESIYDPGTQATQGVITTSESNFLFI